MNLTFENFKKLIALYKDNSLCNDNLIFENCIVPITAVAQAVSITEDAYGTDEKNYLLRNIFDTLVDPIPTPIEEDMLSTPGKKIKI